jgi:hypothetical protein
MRITSPVFMVANSADQDFLPSLRRGISVIGNSVMLGG